MIQLPKITALEAYSNLPKIPAPEVYSELHKKTLQADAWSHQVGLEKIATQPRMDQMINIGSLRRECLNALANYQDKEPDVSLRCDIGYALRILAEVAGPNGTTISVEDGSETKERDTGKFGANIIKEIAGKYNSMVERGETIDRVLVQYFEAGTIQRGYIATDKSQLVLKEVG